MVKRILVVDDDFEDLTAIKDVLNKTGYEIVTATNGAQALDSLKNNKFDLVCIDIQMPTLSGYDLLKLMRERLNHKTPMIYITIVPRKEVDLDDIDGFVQKPFSPDSLIKEVKKVLK